MQAQQQGQSEEREGLLARLAGLGNTAQQDSSPESRARKAASHQASAQVVLQKVCSRWKPQYGMLCMKTICLVGKIMLEINVFVGCR